MYDSPEQPASSQKGAGLAAQLIKHTNVSFFLTGEPGAEVAAFLKTAAINSGKKYIWLSHDSVAAFDTGGTSVYSFFHLSFAPFIWQTADQAQRNIFSNFHAEKIKIIEQVELIIIDDVNLLRADIIDAIDFRLRRFGGKRNQPFGGRQVVFTGDIFQLPEVATDADWKDMSKYYNTPYFFSARVFLKNSLPLISFAKESGNLKTPFTALMELVRSKQVQLPDVQELNQLYAPVFTEEETAGFVTITADAAIAEKLNQQKLDELGGVPHTFHALMEGKFVRERNNDRLLPANEVLILKENTPVIFVKDDEEGRWEKGITGVVAALTENFIRVRILQNGIPAVVIVKRTTWHNNRYEAEAETGAIKSASLGTYTQFPLRHGWAISAADSRGMQFSKAVIDLGEVQPGSGLAFIALCRCKSLKHLKLKTIISEEDLLVRDEIVRMAKANNNEPLIKAAVTAGQVQIHMKELLKQFDKGDFVAAIESFSRAMEAKGNYIHPVYRRLMAFKFARLKRDFQQPQPQQQNILPGVTTTAAVTEPELADLNGRITQLEKLVQEFIDQQHAGNATIKQQDFDLRFTIIDNELESQDRAIKKFEDVLTSLNDAQAEREFINDATTSFNKGLEIKVAELEEDLAGWRKNILILVAILFVLAASALLLAIF